MPKQRASRRHEAILLRRVEVSSMEASVSIQGMLRRGLPPSIESGPWLELRGVMKEPIRDVVDVKISIYAKDSTEPGSARPVSVGAVIRTRPCLDVVLPFPQTDFDRVWSLALHGQLKHAYLAFTKPY